MKTSFVVRLAETDIKIYTGSTGLRNRMKEYVVEETAGISAEAAFTVEVTESERRDILHLLREVNGEDFSCGDSYLEFVAVQKVIAEKMIDHDVLLMHGSAVCMDGEGYIFTAPSGTGKSTHARLWREAYGDRMMMINDDKPMLICREDEIIACGNPWTGKHRLGENVSAKVKAIAFLERNEKNIVDPVKPEEVFELLYLQTYRPKDPARAMKSIELLSRICRNVKMYRLKGNMESDAAIVAYKGMN